MSKTKTKFLSVFLIACLCFVASLGFATFGAFASGNVNSADVAESIKIDKPEPINSTYSGKDMVGVVGSGYALSYSGEGLEPYIVSSEFGMIKAYGKKAGTYGVKATLLPGFVWSDGSTDEYVFQFKVDTKNAKIIAEPASKKLGEKDPKLHARFEGLVEGENLVDGVDYQVYRTGGEEVHETHNVGANVLGTEITSNYAWTQEGAEFIIHGIPVERPQAIKNLYEKGKAQIGIKGAKGYEFDTSIAFDPYLRAWTDENGNACGSEAGTYRLFVRLDKDYEWAEGKRIENFTMDFVIKPRCGYNITFKADNEYGKLEGPAEYYFRNSDRIKTQEDDCNLIIRNIAMVPPHGITKIKAVPNEKCKFVNWTRSDGKNFDANIDSNIDFIAHFDSCKLDPEMKDLYPQKAYFDERSKYKTPKDCQQVIFRKSNSQLIAESSNEDIATVSIIKTPNDEDAVLIKGHNIGKITITVTSTEDDTYKKVSKSFDVDVFGQIPKPFICKKATYDGLFHVGVFSSTYALHNEYYTLVNPIRGDGFFNEVGYGGISCGLYGIYAKLKPGYAWMDDEDSGDIYCEFEIVND